MTPKQKVIARAKELGVTVFKNTTGSEGFTVELDAPQGFIFNEDLHSMVCFGWDDALARMASGLRLCEDEDCDCKLHLVDGHQHDYDTPYKYAQWMGWELIYGAPNFYYPEPV